jgi:hypothetical protein
MKFLSEAPSKAIVNLQTIVNGANFQLSPKREDLYHEIRMEQQPDSKIPG